MGASALFATGHVFAGAPALQIPSIGLFLVVT
jgi:hypothetical protein